ncbi:hypothetical protein [uncultured Gammaproteobacteria bacterium]|nr:hypothetical protein [uncultured Gammaproteobacteria bacterium]
MLIIPIYAKVSLYQKNILLNHLFFFIESFTNNKLSNTLN